MSETLETQYLGNDEWDDVRFMIDYYIPEAPKDVEGDGDKLFKVEDANGQVWFLLSATQESTGQPALIAQTRVDEETSRSYAMMPGTQEILVFNEGVASIMNTDAADEQVKESFEEARKQGLLAPNSEELEYLRPVLAIGRVHRTDFDHWAEQFSPN